MNILKYFSSVFWITYFSNTPNILTKLINQQDNSCTGKNQTNTLVKESSRKIDQKSGRQLNIKCGKDKLVQITFIEYLRTMIRDDGKLDTEILNRT